MIMEMRYQFGRIGLSRLCRILGVTRQAYHQFFWRGADADTEAQLIIQQVKEIRENHPAIGCRKLLYMLQPFVLENQIKIGRDALFDLLSINQLLIKKKRVRVNTTFSNHWLRKYPNLIRGWHPAKPNELWVADITYVPVDQGFKFLSLITDAYSHKIVGYALADNLEGRYTMQALEMALKGRTKPTPGLLHHSDRGMQYCCQDYTERLKENNIRISMTQNGDPLENALAERLNGIVKQEYLSNGRIKAGIEMEKMLPDVIHRYNSQRPHWSIRLRTPNEVHDKELLINRTWPMTRSKAKRSVAHD